MPHRTTGAAALRVRQAPVTAAPLDSRPRLRAATDLGGEAASPLRMGGEAGSRTAVGCEGRVKSLGLVFEDERKGCYSSGETVAGHVLLEACEPVALRALRLEAQGRATAAASQVEYLNVRLSLREPAAGEHRGPGHREGPRGWGAPGRDAPGWLKSPGSPLVSCLNWHPARACGGREALGIPGSGTSWAVVMET